jgi:DNA-binding response OmpR family regulator
MAEKRQTALGVARERFVEGLPAKAREVKASLALLAGTPEGERPRDELRRRLHALYASAQVFRIEPLADALKEGIASIDAVRGQRRGFLQDEIDALTRLASALPALGAGEAVTLAGASSLPPKPSARRWQGLDRVISVLVVDDPPGHARVQAMLGPDRFEVLPAEDAEEALRLARSAAPDVVLADHGLATDEGANLIERLRDDPLTDFVPVVLLLPPGSPLDPIAVREAGADEALVKPFDAARLLKTLARVAESLAGAQGASTLAGELTVEEIADRLADEVKRGLVEAAAQGRDLEIPLGDGTPLMAAAWSAIGDRKSVV